LGTAEQRQEAYTALDENFEHYSAFGYVVAEMDPKVERWLAEVEAVKVEMLKTYRGETIAGGGRGVVLLEQGKIWEGQMTRKCLLDQTDCVEWKGSRIQGSMTRPFWLTH
jgi:hypothetical protein